MAATLQISIFHGAVWGAWQTGLVDTAVTGDLAKLRSLTTTSGTYRFELYGVPPSYVPGAGWTADTSYDPPVYYAEGTSSTSPEFALSDWGNYMPRLILDHGLRNGLPDATQTDSTCAIEIDSSTGLVDTARWETNQLGESWLSGYQANLRTIDTWISVVSPGIGPGAANQVLANLGAGPVWTGAPVVTSVTASGAVNAATISGSTYLTSAGYLRIGATPATAGAGRFSNAGYLYWRDAGDSGNFRILGVDATDRLLVGDGTTSITVDAGASDLSLTGDIVNLCSGTKPSTGSIRIANGKTLYWRTTGGASAHGVSFDASNYFQLGDVGYETYLSGSFINVVSSYLCFGTSITTPLIGQISAASGAGQNLIVQAQGTGNGVAGSLLLRGGIGTTADGDAVLSYGNTARVAAAAAGVRRYPNTAPTTNPATGIQDWGTAAERFADSATGVHDTWMPPLANESGMPTGSRVVHHREVRCAVYADVNVHYIEVVLTDIFTPAHKAISNGAMDVHIKVIAYFPSGSTSSAHGSADIFSSWTIIASLPTIVESRIPTSAVYPEHYRFPAGTGPVFGLDDPSKIQLQIQNTNFTTSPINYLAIFDIWAVEFGT